MNKDSLEYFMVHMSQKEFEEKACNKYEDENYHPYKFNTICRPSTWKKLDITKDELKKSFKDWGVDIRDDVIDKFFLYLERSKYETTN